MDLLTILGPLPVAEEAFAALLFDGDRLVQPALESTPEAAARRMLARLLTKHPEVKVGSRVTAALHRVLEWLA